jgi:hypothetical protein
MTYIEGITPSKKHKTVSERRGSFIHHHDVKTRAQKQKQAVTTVAAISFVVVVGVWLGLLLSGSFGVQTKSSDAAFFGNVTQSFTAADNASFPNLLTNIKTNSSKPTAEELNTGLFPELDI